VASKAGQPEADKVDIEEALDYVDKTLDRTKVLYEQYFLGMQKQPPSQIHTDVERRLRDLQQLQIRNTGLRYRFATLQQKFGSYNSYWRRTLKQIENGTYIRNLQKISRKAALTGEEIPEEILAAMPKRMREQVKRDREQAIAIARRRNDTHADDTDFTEDHDGAAVIGEALEVVRQIPRGGAQVLDEDDADLDFEAFFASVEKSDDTQENAPAYQDPAPPRAAATTVRPAAPVRPSQSMRHDLSVDLAMDDDEATSFEPAPSPRATGSVPVQQSRGTGSVPSRPSGQPATATGTQPPQAGGPQHPRGATQPGTAPPGARPPPPSSRATGPVPVMRQSGSLPTVGQRTSGPFDPTEAIPTLQPGSIPKMQTGAIPTVGQTGSIPTQPAQPAQRTTQPIPTQLAQPAQRTTQPIPTQRATGPVPLVPPPAGSAMDRAGVPASRITGPVPVVPAPGVPASRITGPVPAIPAPGGPAIPRMAVPNIPRPLGAPSQTSKPNPIAPGSSTARPAVPVETMSGPFPRAAAPPVHPRPESPKPAAPKPQATTPRPPPGMNDADVNALYATYVKAKKAVGEEAGPGAYGKLLQTINAQAPKIMQQYKAKGVEFSVVVKDNQVIIKAKPKT